MNYISCILCGKQTEKEIYKDSVIRVVLCNSCGFSYLNPRMSDVEYASYYKNDYQSKRHLLEGYDKAVERLIKKGSYEQKKKHLSFLGDFINNKTKIFEIGCGWGTFLKVLSDTYKCSVQGLEISKLAVEVGRTYYKLPIIESTFEGYFYKNNLPEKNDLIVMHHVLEHFLDPRKVLNILHNFLSQNGLVYIALPNLSRPDEAISKFFRIDHCSYFYPETFNRLLKECGYKVVKFSQDKTDMKFVIAKKDSNFLEVMLPRVSLRRVVYTVKIKSFTDNLKEKIKTMISLFKK